MLKTKFLIVMALSGLGCFQHTFARDKIIAPSNDTNICKDDQILAQSIYFTPFDNEVKTKSVISRKDAELCQVSEEKIPEDNSAAREFRNEKWRFSVSGGGGYRIASTKEARKSLQNQRIPSSEIDSYFSQIKTGIKTSGQVHYMVWENYGLGIDYQLHHSSGSLWGTVDPGDSYTFYYGKFSDNMYTNYIGLSLFWQERINQKIKFFGQISSGLTLYREESVILYTPLLITGKAYGGNTELGVEYFLGRKVSVALSAGFFQSTISRIKVNNGINIQDVKLEKEQMEGLSRVDLGAGLRFYL